MNEPAHGHDWIDANQRLLVAELDRLKKLISGEDDAAARVEIERCRSAMPGPAAIDTVTERFGLSEFERALLLLTAGVEMDAGIGALCAQASGSQQPQVTFGLALSFLPEPHWSALTPVRPLRRWRMVEVADDGALVTARLRIDERVLHYLAGASFIDQRLQPILRRVTDAPALPESQAAAVNTIVEALQHESGFAPLLQLWGNDRLGQEDVAALVAARLGLHLHAVDHEDITGGPHEVANLTALWEREAALLDSALLITCADGAPAAPARRFADRARGLIVLAAGEPVAVQRGDVRHRIDKPSRRDQQHLWEQALGPAAGRLNGAVEGVASQFRLSARDIARVGAGVAQAADVTEDAADLLWQSCHGLERGRLTGLAQRIEPAARFEDLVLPEAQKTVLRQIVAQVRHALRVHEHWGFAEKGGRGLGVSVLFAGESGTGKTMAAEVLANELRLDLFRIDLSKVVSKYIGETEKNLSRVFDAAEDSGSILLFDEADALFGKRSEVKDSHDRYANIEVSYLLQRMEAYRGLAILTSNQKAALDPSFHRRLRFVVQFPFPDALERRAIWREIFPAATPVHGLDYEKLARLHVPGGSIRNIALNAAFFAADAGEPVGMRHLFHAAHAEAAKRDRSPSDGETRGWL